MDWNTLDACLLEHQWFIPVGLMALYALYLSALLVAWIWDRHRVAHLRDYLRRKRPLQTWKPQRRDTPVVDSFYPFHDRRGK